jgi:hypothetical protein
MLRICSRPRYAPLHVSEFKSIIVRLHVCTRRRYTLALLIVVGLVCPVVLARAASRAGASKSAKAAAKCEAAVASGGATLLGARIKGLTDCSNALLTCVDTNAAAKCTNKAAKACIKSLEKFHGAGENFRAQVVKACGAPLTRADLLSADRLGYGSIVGDCLTSFDIDVCAAEGSGIDALAECLVAEHQRAAETLASTEAPRTAELLAAR